MKYKKKSLITNLKGLYGVGDKKAHDFCVFIGADPNIKLIDLSTSKLEALKKLIAYYNKSNDDQAIGNNLKRFQRNQINRKIKLNTLAGRRFKLKLPIRGQRTRSNARNAKRR